jgi:hypothetical protein
MRIAILETVKAPAGFELEFDKIIIDELKHQGHTPVLFLPENSNLGVDLGIHTEYIDGGPIVSYDNIGKLTKCWRMLQREFRRIRWFNAAYDKAKNGEIDAIILTTATYRYLRSLRKSKLKNSPIPIIFVFMGVNPREKKNFLHEARKCERYLNIKLKIISLRNDFADDNVKNLAVISPTVIVPANFPVEFEHKYQEPIKIGFFGHYRKGEKDIEGILRAFVAAKLAGKAQLIVQVAPTREEDATDLDRIIKTYEGEPVISFLKGTLLGAKWYEALHSVDVIFLPYMAQRYIYNWSAIYFNAIGFYKPVLVTPILNPEVLAGYDIGMEVNLQNIEVFKQQLSQFVCTYREKLPIYERELKRANKDFAHTEFIRQLMR